MKPSETTAIYAEACRARRIVPQTEEGALWHKTLSGYDAKDVRTAVQAWSADTTLGKDGVPRGKWLPAPAELKPVVEHIIHDREAKAAVKRYLVSWFCPSCGMRSSGFLAVGESSARACRGSVMPGGKFLPAGQVCGATLNVVRDERPQG